MEHCRRLDTPKILQIECARANRIYLLDGEQWAKFSESIIADCKAKLAQVKEDSFEEGILLGRVAEVLIRD